MRGGGRRSNWFWNRLRGLLGGLGRGRLCGWLPGLRRCLRRRCALWCRDRLRPRLQGRRANNNQNEEEEISAAHSHEDTRIDPLRESYTRDFQRGNTSLAISGAASAYTALSLALSFPCIAWNVCLTSRCSLSI